MFSFVLTKWILLAARQTAVATFRRSDRKPVGLPFRLQTENILLLPLIPTQRILLSTSRRLVPLSLQNGKCFASFPSRQHTRLYFPRGRLLWPSADDQTSDGAHKRAFPYSHIEESTIPHLINQMGPLSLQKGASYCKFPLC